MIARVAPLVRLPPNKDVFDYAIPPELLNTIHTGDMVEISWRSKTVQGIVLAILNTPRYIPYKLKNVGACIERNVVTQAQQDLLLRFCEYYATSEGKVSRMILPDKPKKTHAKHSFTYDPHKPFCSLPTYCKLADTFWSVATSSQAVYARMKSITEFLLFLLSHIATHAHAQTLVLVPTISLARYFANTLAHYGVAESVIVHSELGKNASWNTYMAIKQHTAHIIFATRQGVFLPINDNSFIIVYDAASEDYKQSMQHPKYDARRVALWLSHATRSTLLFAVHTPPLGVHAIDLPTPHIAQTQSAVHLVDMKKELQQKDFSIISEITLSSLQLAINAKKRSIVLALRKHGSTGVSLETIQSVLTKTLKNGKIGIYSADLEKPEQYDVLVGTPILLESLNFAPERPNIELLVIASIEPLLALPDYRSAERAYNRLSYWKLIATQFSIPRIILQSYTPEALCVRAFTYGEYDTFAQSELVIRKQLHYPPFSQLIKLTYKGDDPKEPDRIKKTLANWLKNKATIIGPYQDHAGLASITIKLHIQTSISFLKKMPFNWAIDREPENIL